MAGRLVAGVGGAALLLAMCSAVPHAAAADAFALGDSITVAAAAQLQRSGYEVDAVVGRTFADGIAIIRDMGDELPDRVLVNLGTNSGVDAGQCRTLASLVGPDRDLVLVTVNIPQYPEVADRSNAVLAGCAEAAGARLADWAAYSAVNPGVLCPDGMHISCGGAAAYTRFVLADSPPLAPASSGGGGSVQGGSPRPNDPSAVAEAAAAAAAQAEAARVAAEVEAARLAAEAEAARVAAEAARIAQERADTARRLQLAREQSPIEVDRRVSPGTYRFVSLPERLSAVSASS